MGNIFLIENLRCLLLLLFTFLPFLFPTVRFKISERRLLAINHWPLDQPQWLLELFMLYFKGTKILLKIFSTVNIVLSKRDQWQHFSFWWSSPLKLHGFYEVRIGQAYYILNFFQGCLKYSLHIVQLVNLSFHIATITKIWLF